jgi:hypothetical protein
MDTELAFSYNWNNKLNCNCFTTLRLYSPAKHAVGSRFNVTLKGVHKGYAKIVSLRLITLNQINDFVARLDTGYSANECRDIIRTMYKNQKYIKWDTQQLALCLLVYEKMEKEQFLNFQNDNRS